MCWLFLFTFFTWIADRPPVGCGLATPCCQTTPSFHSPNPSQSKRELDGQTRIQEKISQIFLSVVPSETSDLWRYPPKLHSRVLCLLVYSKLFILSWVSSCMWVRKLPHTVTSSELMGNLLCSQYTRKDLQKRSMFVLETKSRNSWLS